MGQGWQPSWRGSWKTQRQFLHVHSMLRSNIFKTENLCASFFKWMVCQYPHLYESTHKYPNCVCEFWYWSSSSNLAHSSSNLAHSSSNLVHCLIMLNMHQIYSCEEADPIYNMILRRVCFMVVNDPRHSCKLNGRSYGLNERSSSDIKTLRQR